MDLYCTGFFFFFGQKEEIGVEVACFFCGFNTANLRGREFWGEVKDQGGFTGTRDVGGFRDEVVVIFCIWF